MPIRFALLVLAVLCLAFAPAPFPRNRKEPPKQTDFIGRWTRIDRPTTTLVVTADSLTYHNNNKSTIPYHLTFDSTKNPKTYDIVHKQTKRTFAGIYKVEGDTLTLISNSGTNRPTSFTQGKARGYKRLPE